MSAKNFKVYDSNNNVVFEGMGGACNAWAQDNVFIYKNLFVDYYNEHKNIIHWFWNKHIEDPLTGQEFAGVDFEWV